MDEVVRVLQDLQPEEQVQSSPSAWFSIFLDQFF
jgi:hypothetical protein